MIVIFIHYESWIFFLKINPIPCTFRTGPHFFQVQITWEIVKPCHLILLQVCFQNTGFRHWLQKSGRQWQGLDVSIEHSWTSVIKCEKMCKNKSRHQECPKYTEKKVKHIIVNNSTSKKKTITNNFGNI